MSISDKTRKVLWGRSGNRCTICKNELVVDSSGQDDESVIADECHIISSKPNGPRHDTLYPVDKLDSYDNMILLCRTHHKMVDDQTATFTANILRQMKSNHEVWVSQKLAENQKTPPVRIRRVKQNIPAFLFRFNNRKQVLKMAGWDLSASRSGNKSDSIVPVISKRGKGDLRYALYQAAHIASSRNRYFVSYYTDKLRGREKEKGIKTNRKVKLAAKLLIIAWTLMKKQEPFNPDYLNIK
jgi:hypothetical protein